SPHILGKKITGVTIRQPRLRWPAPAELAELLVGKTAKAARRRGKYLLLDVGVGHALIHLGMSASLRIIAADEPPLFHDHFDLVFGRQALRYCEPRRFGCVLWIDGEPESHSRLAGL